MAVYNFNTNGDAAVEKGLEILRDTYFGSDDSKTVEDAISKLITQTAKQEVEREYQRVIAQKTESEKLAELA